MAPPTIHVSRLVIKIKKILGSRVKSAEGIKISSGAISSKFLSEEFQLVVVFTFLGNWNSFIRTAIRTDRSNVVSLKLKAFLFSK